MRGEEVQISSSNLTADVGVIGGGVIGLACAWKVAQRGANVAVIDEVIGRGASWAAAGMLAPVTEVHHGEETLLQLNLESSRLYPSFVRELEDVSDKPVGYRPCGTLMVARDRDDNEALEELFGFQLRLGLSVERLRSAECRQIEPALSPTVRGGILVDGDHQIDNRALLAALEEACVRCGVRFLRGRVEILHVEGDRVAGVELSDGSTLRSDHLVVAAGVRSASLNGLPPQARPPLRPVKGQLLHLRARRGRAFAAPSLSGHNIRGIDVYLVARGDGRVLVGASAEEQGFDTSVTAGVVLELLRDAYELVPGIAELELIETIAGLRPATPDNAPVIGPTSVEGLVMATGHYRNGILLTPVTSQAIADVISSGELPEKLEPFSGRRFEESLEQRRALR
jgi:glycine oxidase